MAMISSPELSLSDHVNNEKPSPPTPSESSVAFNRLLVRSAAHLSPVLQTGAVSASAATFPGIDVEDCIASGTSSRLVAACSPPLRSKRGHRVGAAAASSSSKSTNTPGAAITSMYRRESPSLGAAAFENSSPCTTNGERSVAGSVQEYRRNVRHQHHMEGVPPPPTDIFTHNRDHYSDDNVTTTLSIEEFPRDSVHNAPVGLLSRVCNRVSAVDTTIAAAVRPPYQLPYEHEYPPLMNELRHDQNQQSRRFPQNNMYVNTSEFFPCVEIRTPPLTNIGAADGGSSDDYFQDRQMNKNLLSYDSIDRIGSPIYFDQGYHTLVSESSPVWPATPIISEVYAQQNSPIATTRTKKVSSNHPHHHHHRHHQSCSARLGELLDSFTDNVMLQILSLLTTNELCSASRVCRRWYHLAQHPSLWKCISIHGENVSADDAVKSILRRMSCVPQTAVQNAGRRHNQLIETCFSGVKQLFIYGGAKISDKGLTSLARRCPQLKQVQLHNCTAITDTSISELVSRCIDIQHLDLTGCTQVSCINIKAGPDFAQKLLLQHLDLTDCIVIDDSSLRVILSNSPQITFLYLRRCCRITDAGVKFIPSYCQSMREVSVSDCHLLTDSALCELAKLGPNLRYLSVAKCCQVSDNGLKMLAKRCYKLRYLNLRGCEAVSDDALSTLARSCPRIRALDIGKCDISDAGLKALAENCPNLKKLSLRNCDLVTDIGIQYVCYYCRGLQQLNIQECQISLEGYKAVKRFCKRCIIEHTNPAFF